MKTLVLIFLALPYVVLGQCPPAGNGSLKAEILGNTVVLMNDTVQRNCASWYEMQIYMVTGDTLIWMQNEQGGGADCLCHFNLSLTVDSLEAGNYYVKTFYTNAPLPFGDTCYIGSVSFTITEQNSFASFNISDNYQSDCFYVPVGINMPELTESKFFTVYPNPANDRITIEGSVLTENPIFTIFNINGKKVFERQISHCKKQIDISALKPGVYFVKLKNEKMIEVKKLVKE